MNGTMQLVLRGMFRGLHLVGYFTAFGAMFLPSVLLRGAAMRGLGAIVWAGTGLAFMAGAGWFLLQTAYFASAQNVSDVIAAMPIVAQDTRFGELLIGRLAVLLLAALLFQAKRPRIAALLAFGGVVAEAWLGHGAAMGGREGAVLLGSAIVHIAAAALWLGTLPALCLAIATVQEPGPLARRYSPLGVVCIVLLLLTAFIQYTLLIARPAAFITSFYGAVALAKIILLILLIMLAARNRLSLTPALPETRPALLRAIGGEMALGLLVLLAAGLLLQLEPPAMAGLM